MNARQGRNQNIVLTLPAFLFTRVRFQTSAIPIDGCLGFGLVAERRS